MKPTALSLRCSLLPSLASAADFGVDAHELRRPGAGRLISSARAIGVLSWLTFYFADKTIGASSFYATLAGFVGKAVAPKHTESLPYYKDNPPAVDWGFIFVVFTIVGALHRGVDRRRVSQRMAAPDVGR